MAEHHNGQNTVVPIPPVASAARLRSLARSSFDTRIFLRNITAVEIAAIVGLLGLISAAFVIYFAWILPDQVRSLQLSNEVANNRTNIESLTAQAGDPASLTVAYQQVHESLDAFRGQMLQPRTAGRLQIINLVNDLTRNTGVSLDGPISFQAENLEVEQDEGTSERKTRVEEDEIRTYPSLGMAMSISGSYSEIRSFLAKFESSRQFAIIDSVSISSQDDDEGEGARAGRRGDAGRSDSAEITLEITMTAYFQPDVVVVTSTRPVADAGGAR